VNCSGEKKVIHVERGPFDPQTFVLVLRVVKNQAGSGASNVERLTQMFRASRKGKV